MTIQNRTTAEIYTLSSALENTLKDVLVYRSESRNPARETALNARLTSLKTVLDATVADAVAPGAGT